VPAGADAAGLLKLRTQPIRLVALVEGSPLTMGGPTERRQELVEDLLLIDDAGRVHAACAWAEVTYSDEFSIRRRVVGAYSFRFGDGTPLIRQSDDSFAVAATGQLLRRAGPSAKEPKK
jgi:hypothetical protein